MASLEFRDLIGRIHVGDHTTLLYTKYISCGPHGFRDSTLDKQRICINTQLKYSKKQLK